MVPVPPWASPLLEPQLRDDEVVREVQLIRQGRLGRLAIVITNRRGFVVEKSTFGGDAVPFRLPSPEGMPRTLECAACDDSFLAFLAPGISRLHCPTCGTVVLGDDVDAADGKTGTASAHTAPAPTTPRAAGAATPATVAHPAHAHAGTALPHALTGATPVREAVGASASLDPSDKDIPMVLASAMAAQHPMTAAAARMAAASDPARDANRVARATRQMSLHDADAILVSSVPEEPVAATGVTLGEATNGTLDPAFVGFKYHGFGLFRIGNAADARYVFARTPPSGSQPAAKPKGFDVGVNPRTGLPCLIRGEGNNAISGRLPRPAGVAPVPARPDDLDALDGIGPKRRERLEAAGYTSARKLVEADLATLAEVAGVTEKTAEPWQTLGGILSLPGVGIDEGEALLAAGIGSAKALARADPDDLADRVNKVLAEREGGGVTVTAARVKAWVEAARVRHPQKKGRMRERPAPTGK